MDSASSREWVSVLDPSTVVLLAHLVRPPLVPVRRTARPRWHSAWSPVTEILTLYRSPQRFRRNQRGSAQKLAHRPSVIPQAVGRHAVGASRRLQRMTTDLHHGAIGRFVRDGSHSSVADTSMSRSGESA
jgi:hypothetical protein